MNRHVAFSRCAGFEISTVLLSSGDCFETIAFTASGREQYTHQTLSRATALENHARAVEMCRAGVLPEKSIYVSFVRSCN